MNGEIAINTATLGSDIADMEIALSNVRSRMKSMQDAIEQLNTMWEGEAKKAFNQQFRNDYADMEALCETILSLISCMQYAKGEYASCENTIENIINAINI